MPGCCSTVIGAGTVNLWKMKYNNNNNNNNNNNIVKIGVQTLEGTNSGAPCIEHDNDLSVQQVLLKSFL
ncbi:hypothetical protein HanXRQr2_Chr08g0358011 [Helianthus annuus]|uniref:Uncharacterized protein n=1 Tax=Helianthus annuus TaxID=4232 RepID=A0A9K3IHI3_HELAN|nr:hypothetical protein HanXRQr2_Chr08g0358011 [Helianthus annuus]KAJ0903138.1 hypothetical protein HanPSC8_Chr08g0345541 [Helianthus annuus]